MMRLLIMGLIGAVAAGTLFSTVGKIRRKGSSKGSVHNSGSNNDGSHTVSEGADSQDVEDDDIGMNVFCCPSLLSSRSYTSREISAATVVAAESLRTSNGVDHNRLFSRHSLDKCILSAISSEDLDIVSRDIIEKAGIVKSSELGVKLKARIRNQKDFVRKPTESKIVPNDPSTPVKLLPHGNVDLDSGPVRKQQAHSVSQESAEHRLEKDSTLISTAGLGFVRESDSLPVARVITFSDTSLTRNVSQTLPATEMLAVRTISRQAGEVVRKTQSKVVVKERFDAISSNSVHKGNDKDAEIPVLLDTFDSIDEGWEVMEELLTQQQCRMDDNDSNLEFFDAEDAFNCTPNVNHEKTKNSSHDSGPPKSAKVLEEAWELVTHLKELEKAISVVGSKEAEGAALSAEQFEAMFGRYSEFDRSLNHKHRRWLTDYSELCDLSIRDCSGVVKLDTTDFKCSLYMESDNVLDEGNAVMRSGIRNVIPCCNCYAMDDIEMDDCLEGLCADSSEGKKVSEQGNTRWSDGDSPVEADLAEGPALECLHIEMSPSDASALAEALVRIPLVTCRPAASLEYPVTKMYGTKKGLPMDTSGAYKAETYRTCWFRGHGGDTSDDEWDSSSPSSTVDGSLADDMNLDDMIELMENVIAERTIFGEHSQICVSN